MSSYLLSLVVLGTLSTAAAQRVGAICKDGWHSTSTGRGTCSQHGGVAHWLYKTTPSPSPDTLIVVTPSTPTPPSSQQPNVTKKTDYLSSKEQDLLHNHGVEIMGLTATALGIYHYLRKQNQAK